MENEQGLPISKTKGKPAMGAYQQEKTVRAYDKAELIWRREMGQWDWLPWILIRVDGEGPKLVHNTNQLLQK